MTRQQEKRQDSAPFSYNARKETHRLMHSVKDILQDRSPVAGITIDGPTSKDLDDALWLEERADGGLTLLVSIADVGALIGSQTPALDQDARERGFTRYFSAGNRPMLPRSLSEQALSLLEGELRPTITLSVPFDTHSRVQEPSVSLTALTSQRRFSYDEIEEELVHPTTTFGPMIQTLSHLCQALLQQRRAAGALALYDLVHGWATTEEGTLIPLSSGQRNHGHIIVQECMILANQVFASYLAERGVPALYRNHVAQSIAPPRATLLQLLDNAMNHPEHISPDQLRTTTTLVLGRAMYGPTVEGHFGLHVPVYTHMTSPLRRYPDLINQRILHAQLRGRPSPHSLAELIEIAAGINTTEREIKEAKKASYLEAYDEALRQEVSLTTETGASRPLSHLDTRQFHSVLRMSAETGALSPETKGELLHRLAEEQLAAHDLFLLLYRYTMHGEDWDEIKETTITHVCEHPYLAVSLLMMGQQNLGWGEAHYHVRAVSSMGPFQASVRVQIADRVYQSATYTASTKVEARQLAAADVATQVAGFAFAEEENMSEPSSVEIPQQANQEKVPQAGESRNYKGQLQEMAQRHGWQLPSYQLLGQEGPPHAPVFTVAVEMSMNGQSYSETGTGNTKGKAEQQAAQQLSARLQEIGAPGMKRK